MPIGNMLAAFGNRPSVLQQAAENENIAMTNRLNQYKLESAIRDEQKKNKLSELYSRGVSGDKSAFNEMAGVDPVFHQQVQKNLIDMEKGQRDQLMAQLEESGRMALAADTPDKWSQLFPDVPFEQRGQLISRASAAKGVFDAIQEQEKNAYNRFKDDRAFNLDASQFNETRRHNRETEKISANKSGASFTVGPDGTVTYSEGGTVGLQKPTLNKIEDKQLNATESLSRLNNINASFKPEFLTYGAGWTQLKSRVMEKSGVPLSKEDSTKVREFSRFKRDALSNLNRTINELTGAAMAEKEAQRIVSELPNPGQSLFDGDGPTEFKAKLDAATRDMKRAIIRYNYAKQAGLNPFKIDLADVDALMDRRGSEIEAQLKAQNPNVDPNTLDAMVRDQLNREFGVE